MRRDLYGMFYPLEKSERDEWAGSSGCLGRVPLLAIELPVPRQSRVRTGLRVREVTADCRASRCTEC
jgi:hypothetical protein